MITIASYPYRVNAHRLLYMQRPLFDSGEVVLNVNKGAAVTMAGSSHLNCALAGYRSNLDDTSRTWYDQKIGMINHDDPYMIENGKFTCGKDKWPSLCGRDILLYLLVTTTHYTLEEFRSYKGLESYNQFINGWVQDSKVTIINNLHLYMGKVCWPSIRS